MKILFTICGRAGSKGIKNKNLRDFCKKPLVYYSISAIDIFIKNNTGIECDIVVNSDSAELIELVCSNKMRPIESIVRDESLGGDAVGKIDVIRDCRNRMQKRLSKVYDLIIDLDITSPLRTADNLQNVYNLAAEKMPDVTTTVAPARRNPYFNQVMRTDRGVRRVVLSEYTARQQAPEIFDMNASIYAYNPDFLDTNKGVLDGYCEIVEMYDTGILDLDHENDFELMEVIASYLFEKNPEFAAIRDNIV